MRRESNVIYLYWWRGGLTKRYFFSNLLYRVRNNLPIIINNFGDQLSPVIVKRLSGKEVVFSKKKKLVALGSLFSCVRAGDVVWGTGMMRATDIPPSDIDIAAVRGPLTAKRLIANGIDCPDVYGDPALLISYLFRVVTKKRYRVGIVPHYEDLELIKKEIRDPAVKIISPLNDFRQVILEVNSCEVILASSLHGVIISESYSIPTAYVLMSEKTGGGIFKYEDYFQSTGRDLILSDWRGGIDIDDAVKKALQGRKPVIDLNRLLLSFPFLKDDIRTLDDISTESLYSVDG